jgi:hypothetical protein
VILPDAAVGSIVAATIAGLVAFVSTVLTKEQKTSEFRQLWIDELRKEISEFISGVTEFTSLHKFKLGDDIAYAKFLDDNIDAIHKLQTLEHQIVLRLNPDEHAVLINEVKTFRKNVLNAYQTKDRAAREEELTNKFLDATKEVLTQEWRRVKKGEPTFRWVKNGALIAVIAFFSALVAALFVDQPNAKLEQSSPSSTVQIFQYLPPGEPPKPVRKVVKQIQNNATIVEMSLAKDCTKPDSCRTVLDHDK